jgi:hypothetical protein
MPFDAIKCCRKAEIPPELMRYCNAFETKQKHEEYDEDFSEASDDEELPLLLQRITVPSPQNSLREAIVLSQSASGYWDRFDLLKLMHIAKSKFAALVKEIAAMYGLPEDETKIIALSLLVWVHLSYIDMEHRDEHQHLIDKAERWFTGQGIDYPAWAPQWQKIL